MWLNNIIYSYKSINDNMNTIGTHQYTDLYLQLIRSVDKNIIHLFI